MENTALIPQIFPDIIPDKKVIKQIKLACFPINFWSKIIFQGNS